MTPEQLESRLREQGVAVTLAGMVRERAAADALGVNERTLRRWRDTGLGPQAHTLNGRTWYAIATLAAWLDKQ
jgi:hypothetical protein